MVKKAPELKLDQACKLQFFYPRTIDKNLRLISSLGIASQVIVEKAKKAGKYWFDVDAW